MEDVIGKDAISMEDVSGKDAISIEDVIGKDAISMEDVIGKDSISVEDVIGKDAKTMEDVIGKEEVLIEDKGIEEISRRLCCLLNGIGYSQQMIELRRNAYKEISSLINNVPYTFKRIQAGRKGEGLTKWFESDMDAIFLVPDVYCVEDRRSERFHLEQMTVFEIIITHPGYCVLEGKDLKPPRNNVDYKIHNSLVPYKNKCLLSSTVIGTEIKIDGLRQDAKVCKRRPAQTEVVYNGVGEIDNLLALSSSCPKLLQKWSNRPWKHDWPPLFLRQSILEMKGNLVSTGMKGSETEDLEWRFCFNEIELLLFESLNDIQMKLYKMLKMINTDVLKGQGHNITSYIMKNIVFWLAEAYPQSEFRPETLFSWIIKALRLLKRAVKAYDVPYYMIPERNLLKEKVSESERRPLQLQLALLIKSGPEAVFQ